MFPLVSLHFPSLPLALTSSSYPLAASGAYSAPTHLCRLFAQAIPYEGSSPLLEMPGFLFALKSQPHLERLSLQHSLSSCLPLFSGFVFTSYTNHHLICPPKGISSRRDTCLSSVPGTMSGWHRISAQPFQEGGQEGKP